MINRYFLKTTLVLVHKVLYDCAPGFVLHLILFWQLPFCFVVSIVGLLTKVAV